MIKVFEFYKKSVQHDWRLPHNLVSIFHVKNASPGKTEKTMNISNPIQHDFHLYRNDHTVSGDLILVTDDLEKVGQCQN